MNAYRWDLLAGFACGWTLASEYSSGLAVLGILFLITLLNWRRVETTVVNCKNTRFPVENDLATARKQANDFVQEQTKR